MANANISFKIIGLDKVMGQMIVRYTTPEMPEGMTHAIDLPVQNGKIVPLAGQQLTDYIMGFAPVSFFERLKAVQEGGAADLSHIEAMVQPDEIPAATPAPADAPSYASLPVERVL